ncbi:hypothetical protein FACS1894199_06070 [Bacteroidia bacterium]|nr:hypothetical protein FACS1894199_06070 [Bacteroidia bacterium]
MSNGVVIAEGAGTATITVTTDDGNHTATCTVTVNAVVVPPPPSNDADLQNLTVVSTGTLSPTFDPNITDYTLTLPCAGNDSSVNIIATAPGTVKYLVNDSERTMPIVVRIGTTPLVVRSIAADGTTKKDYNIRIIRPFPASVIVQYWNNILAVNLNEETNGGHTFTAFQWQRNDVDIAGETDAYLHLTTAPLSTDRYGVALTVEGQPQAVPACPQQFVAVTRVSSTAGIKVYPNPVVNGRFTIDNAQLPVGGKVEIYNMNGGLVGVHAVSDGVSTVVNVQDIPAGIYVVRAGKQSTLISIE